MKIIKLIIPVFLIALTCSSQDDKLIPEAKEIKLAFENLEMNPNSTIYQEKYISVFPGNAAIFKKVFASPGFDQLYDGRKYILKLYDLSMENSDKVGNKLVNLCVELKKWDADAVGYVQKITMDFANSSYQTFIPEVRNLNQKDQTTLIAFLADVENHSAYKPYQDFINRLSQNKEETLLAQFKKAREERIKQREKH